MSPRGLPGSSTKGIFLAGFRTGAIVIFIEREGAGMRFSRIERVTLARPADDVLSFFWDLDNLSTCVSRMEVVKIVPHSFREGQFVGKGLLGGIAWSGTFAYRLTLDGLDSHLIAGPPGMRAEIRIKVRSAPRGRSRVTHSERYEMPLADSPRLRSIAPPLAS